MSKASSKGRTVVGAYGCEVGLSSTKEMDDDNYDQTTSSLNTGTATAPVNKAREGYHQTTSSLKTGTKS